jgi:hypothetical protein
MKILSNLIVLAFIALLLGGCANRASRPQPLPGHEAEVSNALLPCPDGLERFLPGEYYFCDAARDYWTGDMDRAVQVLGYSAEWANKPAQYALGVMYFNGDRIPVNRPLGIAWLAIAAERHDPQYEAVFVSAYRSATAQEREQANTYWRSMKPVYSDKVAAVRAIKRFNREITPIYNMVATNGGRVYISGLTLGSSELDFERLMRKGRDQSLDKVDGTVTVGDVPMVKLGSLVGPPEKQNQ